MIGDKIEDGIKNNISTNSLLTESKTVELWMLDHCPHTHMHTHKNTHKLLAGGLGISCPQSTRSYLTCHTLQDGKKEPMELDRTLTNTLTRTQSCTLLARNTSPCYSHTCLNRQHGF